MKKTLSFVVLLFLLIGIVAASENITNDTQDTLSLDETPQDAISIEDNATSDDVPLKANDTPETPLKVSSNSTPAPEKPTITVSQVTGTQGKYITLKATVKNSTGPVSGVKVTFTLNGKTYTATSNANGIASVKVKCPSSAVLKVKQKKRGNKLIKTTYYKKTYTAKASADGVAKTFKVISKKANRVLKYRIVKKNKEITVPVKKNTKIYKRGLYALVTYKTTKYGINFLGAAMAKKGTDGTIQFFAKLHFKQNGKWYWMKWTKVPKNKMYQSRYPSNIQVDKMKAKYTQVTYKRIR